MLSLKGSGVAKGGPIKTQKPDLEKDTKGKMAAPDYYVKRMEALMDLGYDYDEAGRIAMDFDEYQEVYLVTHLGSLA